MGPTISPVTMQTEGLRVSRDGVEARRRFMASWRIAPANRHTRVVGAHSKGTATCGGGGLIDSGLI